MWMLSGVVSVSKPVSGREKKMLTLQRRPARNPPFEGACLTSAGGELKMKGNLLLYKFTRLNRPGVGSGVRVESAGPSFF